MVEEVQRNVQGMGPLVSEVEELALHYQRPAAKNEERENVGPLVSTTDREFVSCPHFPDPAKE